MTKSELILTQLIHEGKIYSCDAAKKEGFMLGWGALLSIVSMQWWNKLHASEQVMQMYICGIDAFRTIDSLTDIEIMEIYESLHVA